MLLLGNSWSEGSLVGNFILGETKFITEEEPEHEGLTRTPKSDHMKSSLNLVLCGRTGANKTSAAKAIVGQRDLHSASNSSQCVQHQAELSGRLVSLVELPALFGKP